MVDVVNTRDMEWQKRGLNHRSDNIAFKYLFKGEPGTPENYALVMSDEAHDFDSPRHRHNFDQIRFCLEGAVPLAPRKVLKAGEAAYFPEGAHYGPQQGKEDRVVLVLQFGGAAGHGYHATEQDQAAAEEMLAFGTFEGGVFRRTAGEGRKNQDGFEAIWEYVTGTKVVYDGPRYAEPVIMKPDGFAWRPGDEPGVEHKTLGVFTEREVRVEMTRTAAGGRHVIAPENALRLCFVTEGDGTLDGEAYYRQAAFKLEPGEGATLAAGTETSVFTMVLPPVAVERAQAA
jgi:hypothetical protein